MEDVKGLVVPTTTGIPAVDAGAESTGFRVHIPDGKYDSREELLADAQNIARRSGFALSVGRSHRRYIYLNCSRGGHYTNRLNLTDDTRRRRTRTRKTGCLYQLRGSRVHDHWVITTLIDQHNHAPEHADANPRHRRMTSEQVAEVERLTRAGARPATIINAIRSHDPNFAGNSRTIYNVRAGLRRAETGVRPASEYLLAELASQSINRPRIDGGSTATATATAVPAAAATGTGRATPTTTTGATPAQANSLAPIIETPQIFTSGVAGSLATAIPAALPPIQSVIGVPALPRH